MLSTYLKILLCVRSLCFSSSNVREISKIIWANCQSLNLKLKVLMSFMIDYSLPGTVHT